MADSNASFGIVLWSTDVPGLAEFLSAVSSTPIAEQHPGYARLANTGLHVEIHGDEVYRGHPWHDALKREGAARGIGAEVRIGVRDAQEAYRLAVRMGATAMYAPYADQGIVECQVLGPDGYLVSLWSPAQTKR